MGVAVKALDDGSPAPVSDKVGALISCPVDTILETPAVPSTQLLKRIDYRSIGKMPRREERSPYLPLK